MYLPAFERASIVPSESFWIETPVATKGAALATLRKQLRERPEPRLISFPAFYRGRIDGLSCLPQGRRIDDPRICLRPQAFFVPVQVQKVDEPPYGWFWIADDFLVLNFDH